MKVMFSHATEQPATGSASPSLVTQVNTTNPFSTTGVDLRQGIWVGEKELADA